MDDILADQCAMEDPQTVPSDEETTTDNGKFVKFEKMLENQ